MFGFDMQRHIEFPFLRSISSASSPIEPRQSMESPAKQIMEKIRYELRARQRVDVDEPIEHAHQRIFAPLAAQSGPWKLKEMPPAPSVVGGNLSAHCNLRRYLPGIAKGYMNYQLRRDFAGSLMSDDWLELEFTPDVATYVPLLAEMLPLLIRSMHPYVVELGDVRFRDPVISEDGVSLVGAERACRGTLYPVFFLSAWALFELYHVELDEAVRKLTPIAEQVTRLEEGVYVIGSSRILEFEEAVDLAHRLEASLEPSSVSFFSRALRKLGFPGTAR